MALLPIVIACVLSAGVGRGDFDARICDAVDDLNADVAFGYAGGCALDADAWRDRLVSIHDRHARLRNALTAAEAAWRNGRDRAARNALDNFYQILRERPGVGPAAWRPGESAANAYKVLGLDDRIAIEARARPDPAGGFRFEPGGTVTIEAEGASHTLTIQSGSLGLTTNEETDPRTVPTEFVLGLRGGGLDALLRLDPACPHNGLVTDADGRGRLGVAVTLESTAPALGRLASARSGWSSPWSGPPRAACASTQRAPSTPPTSSPSSPRPSPC